MPAARQNTAALVIIRLCGIGRRKRKRTRLRRTPRKLSLWVGKNLILRVRVHQGAPGPDVGGRRKAGPPAPWSCPYRRHPGGVTPAETEKAVRAPLFPTPAGAPSGTVPCATFCRRRFLPACRCPQPARPRGRPGGQDG